MAKANKLNKDSKGIILSGHWGTWYVIDVTSDGKYFLLEHETYGEDAAHIIVTPTGRIKLEEVWNGFIDLDDELGTNYSKRL